MESSNEGGGVADECSFQTGLWFGTVFRDIYARIRTYYVRPKIFGETKGTPRRKDLGMDIHVEHVCKRSGPSLKKRRGHFKFFAENIHMSGRCLQLLGASVGSGFCVTFHWRFTTGRSDLWMFAWKKYGQISLEVLAVASFRQKWGKKGVHTETPDRFWPFWWPVVGGDTWCHQRQS